MTLKYAGIVMIVIVCTAAGMLKSLTLSKRVSELEAFISALGFISTEIRFFATPADVILSKLSSQEIFSKLKIFGFCGDFLSKTHEFKLSWEKALERSKPYLSLNKDDLEAIQNFGTTFGTTDADGEIANCERYIHSLKQRLDSARNEKAKRSRMYLSLGLLTGILIAAIFI